jgi:hypothetical protein
MKKLRLGPIRYDVEHVVNLKDGDTELMGCILYQEGKIYLRKNMGKQMSKAVFLHEIVHGILNQAGTQEHSEQVIDAIAFGLLDLSRNKPGFIKINFEGYVE